MNIRRKASAAAGIAALALIVSACPGPYEATDDRPGIPVPTSYEGSVAETSEVLVVETAAVAHTDFQPQVTAIWNEAGTQIYSNAGGKRLNLMSDGAVVSAPVNPSNAGDAVVGPGLSSAPQLVFERYWKRISGPTRYAAYKEISHTTSTTTSVSNTETYSFTESLSIEATVSADFLFGSASVTASASFEATQEFTTTNTSATTYSETFTVTGQPNSCVYTVWQLHERLRYVDSAGETYDDPKYDFAPSSVVWDYPTAELVPIITYF